MLTGNCVTDRLLCLHVTVYPIGYCVDREAIVLTGNCVTERLLC